MALGANAWLIRLAFALFHGGGLSDIFRESALDNAGHLPQPLRQPFLPPVNRRNRGDRGRE